MPPIAVAKFAYNERADAKMWEHGIEHDRFSELLENRHVTTRNRKGRAVVYLLIALDNSGRGSVAPIVATTDPFVDTAIDVSAGPDRGGVRNIRFTHGALSRLYRAVCPGGMSTHVFTEQSALACLPHEARR